MKIIFIIAAVLFGIQGIGRLAQKVNSPNVSRPKAEPRKGTEKRKIEISQQPEENVMMSDMMPPIPETDETAESEPIPDFSPSPRVERRAPSSPIREGEIGGGSDVLEIDSQKVLQGIIFSEILGKPKARRLR